MIDSHDRPKVLDFGLAKLSGVEAVHQAAMTLTAEPLTATGSVLGTLPYMSPEQVEGKPIDRRTDIFSLGVVLYEMVTGRRPFSGETSAALVSSILRDTPALASEVNPHAPWELARAIRRCLAKDPSQRFQTAIDLRNELTELQQDLSTGPSRSAPAGTRKARGGRRETAVAIAVAAAAVALSAIAFRAGRGREHGAAMPTVAFEQLTAQAGVQQYPSLSPDGKWIVYEGHAAGNADIYLQAVGGQNAINLTKDSDADDTEPAFSPDGEWIAFRSERAGAAFS